MPSHTQLIFYGLSTSLKPTGVHLNDLYFETDTGERYFYSILNEWINFKTQDYIIKTEYDALNSSIYLYNNSGWTFTISGITGGGGSIFTGGTVIGPTIFISGLSANTISATTYQNLPINNFITGGTFNSGTNTLNLVNYTGGTVSITGFTSGSGGTSNLNYYITGSTPSGTINSGDRWFDTSSGYELVYINDGNSSQWIQPNNNGQVTISMSSGGTSTGSTITSGDYLPLSGGTVTGATIYTAGLTVNTISATTYYNLPVDIRVTGGTYSNGTTTFTNNTGGTFTVTGFYTGNSITQGITGVTAGNGLSASTSNNVITVGFSGGSISSSTRFTNGLTANTISATTYYNLPIDIKVTGGTYSAGTATFTNNTGGTFSVTGFSTGSSVTQGITGVTAINGLSASTSGNVTTIGFSGGTIPNSTNFTGGLSANTISATTYQNLPTDIRTTGGTYSNNTFTFTNNTGGTYSVLFNTLTGLTINGGLTVTGNTSLQGLTANTISATTYVNLPIDVRVTGGTYSAGTATFTNNTGGTFSVTGFSTGSSVTQGITGVTAINGLSASTSGNVTTIGFSGGTIPNSVNFTNGLTANTISATTYQNLPLDNTITGATYLNNTFIFTNNTGGTFNVLFNTVTGLTVNGNLTVTGNTSLQSLTATTISATTYQNLPTDIRTTGGTYSNNTFTFTNNTGGTYSVLFNTLTGLTINGGLTVTGNTSLQGLTATTISATTYQNLPTDIRTTGGTYSNNTFTFTNNTGGTYSVLFNTVTGLTVNGNLTVTGNTISPTHSGVTFTSRGIYGIATIDSSNSPGMLVVSGSGTVGGASYVDFLRVTNTSVGATNPNKTIRLNNTGGIEFLNSVYTANTLTLGDNGILSIGGGNASTTSSNDGVTNYLSFNNNNSQIYDDGNFHIHSRSANQAMWVNTNNGALYLLTQSPTSGGAIGTGIGIATTSLIGYVTINTGKTYTTSASYGYLVNSASPTGQYPGGSQSVSISLYATARIWGQEIDAFSDERMKDIQGEIKLDDAIKLVNTLVPIKYTWKEGDDKGLKAGYSAQQVVKAGFEHLIGLIPKEGLEETIDEDGFVSPKDTQFSMNYDQVTPYHGVVIKNLLERVEELERQIKELKNSK